MKEVEKRLNALRESIDVSQVKLAEALSSTRSSINRHENGQSTISAELFRRYADFFDVSSDYLFARTDKPQGVIYEFKSKATPDKEKIRRFIDMCFLPEFPMNEKQKEIPIFNNGGCKMKENAFRSWLCQQGYDSGTINSRVSNCIRVDNYEGDLDMHYQNDKCDELVDKLSYSSKDERLCKKPLHSIPINGNIRNGTATLKQAVRLYISFLDNELTHRKPMSQEPTDNVCATQDKNRSQDNAVMHKKPMIDSYAQFLDYFGLDKMNFYSFGIDNTIFVETDRAMRQWVETKNRLFNNQPIAIRGYGRQGAHTQLYLDLYSSLFGNDKIYVDQTNNTAPRRNLQNATGYRININLMNYQCSHIFGHTKNPLLFEAVWNLCFTPKMFDPFTGHETKGLWPIEYQKEFQQVAYARFHEFIEDYNALIINCDVANKIVQFVKNVGGKYEQDLLHKFRTDALSEWEKISL